MPLKQTFINITLFATLLLATTGCGSNSEKAPDVSNVNINLQTQRFDLDLYALDTNHLAEGLVKLHQKYPDFLDYFLDTLMAYNIHRQYNDTVKGVREGLRVFLTFKDFKGLEDTIKKYYPTNTDVDDALKGGFKLLKYYVPSYHIPHIMYLNMGLSNWPSFPLDSTTVCIGLDMFLGDQYPYYKSIGVPDYMGAHLRRNYIPVSVFSTVYKAAHPYIQDERTLLDLMLQRGREQYFLHKIMPQLPDSVLFGFTQIQLDWCNKNEADIYNFFVRNEMLYNKESVSRFSYVCDGPFAQGMEPPSDIVKYTPGNVGTWLGYKIVTAYMNRFQKTPLSGLVDMKPDASRFLDSARYRPR